MAGTERFLLSINGIFFIQHGGDSHFKSDGSMENLNGWFSS